MRWKSSRGKPCRTTSTKRLKSITARISPNEKMEKGLIDIKITPHKL
jgi:hypothetical protein